ncbi:MAG: HD-GYP domain-containing protein [Candidatus Omnitrophota bacterium]|nr:HD-GYP domain-containing protein [Candidatus Omnitrophota bacterium]
MLFIGIFISGIGGLLISKRIIEPIKKLLEGTRRIARGDLEYKVSIKSGDEIGELADSFNKMAESLFESRKKLQDYFYRVVQTLVRILEAKDSYTCGHSDRVAEYSEKIALKPGLSPTRIALLKKAALLHDIGKLGIHESILNKQEKLTKDEWKEVRGHPIIGEDILKSVSLDEEFLTAVRSHYERFDGKGYPDEINGDRIDIYAQIVAVADAYDAMTSTRAYRQNLSREAAIEELKKNCGTQFNPVIVEIFLKILKEEQIGA